MVQIEIYDCIEMKHSEYIKKYKYLQNLHDFSKISRLTNVVVVYYISIVVNGRGKLKERLKGCNDIVKSCRHAYFCPTPFNL